MAQSHDPSPSSQSETAWLPGDLFRRLWAQITSRLRGGEVLLSNNDFRVAIEEEYADVTGAEPSADIIHEIRSTVEAINRDHPQTYLAQGMQNSVNRAFEAGARQLNWDANKIQEKGARSLQRFSQLDAVRELFEDLNLRPNDIDALSAILRRRRGDRRASRGGAQTRRRDPACRLIRSTRGANRCRQRRAAAASRST